MRKLPAAFFLPVSCLLFLASSLYADSQSPHYKVESDFFSGGGELSLASSGYRVEEGIVDWTNSESFASAHYQGAGKIGISDALVPVVQSIVPGDYAKFYLGQSPSFTVTAKDPDADPLQYQFKVDGKVKVPFQSSNVFAYPLAAADRGRHTLAFEVRDNSDGTVSARQFAYAFRRPVK